MVALPTWAMVPTSMATWLCEAFRGRLPCNASPLTNALVLRSQIVHLHHRQWVAYRLLRVGFSIRNFTLNAVPQNLVP